MRAITIVPHLHKEYRERVKRKSWKMLCKLMLYLHHRYSSYRIQMTPSRMKATVVKWLQLIIIGPGGFALNRERKKKKKKKEGARKREHEKEKKSAGLKWTLSPHHWVKWVRNVQPLYASQEAEKQNGRVWVRAPEQRTSGRKKKKIKYSTRGNSRERRRKKIKK